MILNSKAWIAHGLPLFTNLPEVLASEFAFLFNYT
jgi:hypothetical protein